MSDSTITNTTSPHGRTASYEARAYAAPGATSPLAPATIRRREPGAARRADRHPLLRRLPLGPAPGPQRVAERHADRLPLRAGPRDRRPGREGGQRRPQVQGRRPGGGRLHGRLVPHLRQLPGRAGAVLRGPATFTYNGPDKHLGGVTYGGYSESIVVDEAFVLRVLGQAGPGRRGAAAVRRHHHLLAAAALEGRQGAEGRHRRPRRARAHGREVRQRVRRPRRPVHHVARQGGGRGPAGRPRGGRLRERRRDAEARRAASTSSSTRSRPRTT